MSLELTIKMLRKSLNRSVIVRIKGGKLIRGLLVGFDEHLNLVLKNAEFIHTEEPEYMGDVILRGDNVVLISPRVH